MNIINKVTAFILRERDGGQELLLFRHPHAGVQIPAGTVDDGESPEDAVLREVAEETGLRSVRIVNRLGTLENELSPRDCVVHTPTTVYARPDSGSFDWAWLPRGTTVELRQTAGDWTQISYVEWDRYPDPQYISMQITGWAPDDHLAHVKRRHFFQLALTAPAAERWEQHADRHIFSFFWAPLSALPEIVKPQDRWLDYIVAS